MKQKIIYVLVTLAILLLGVVLGVKLADYQHKKTSDKAFNAGLKISNQIKEGKSSVVYKAALSDFTSTTSPETFDTLAKPFANPSLKTGEAILYSDGGSGYVFVQSFTNDKAEYAGQLTVALVKEDNGNYVAANVNLALK